jgi:hypothetical protein
MFDMKKGDLPGQTSLLERVGSVETHPAKSKQVAKLQHAGGPATVAMPTKVTEKQAPAKQRSKLAERVRTYRAEHVEQAQPHLYGKAGKTYDVGVRHIEVDPERFQYKIETAGPSGTGSALKDVEHWNPDLAGAIQVWRDPANGKTYVVNGHHRVALAQRLGVKDITAKFLDAPDAKTARGMGAATNIAEGRGSAVDAAKFFRDMHMTAQQAKGQGISLKEHTANQGLAMASLSDRVFKRVVNKEITPNRAAIIGSHGLDHTQQEALVKLLDKPKNRNLTDGTVAKLAARIGTSENKVKVHKTLFGDDPAEESNFVHRARLEDSITRGLAGDERLFNAVSKSKAAKALEERGGTTVNVSQTGEVGREAAHVGRLFDQLAGRHPAVYEPLNRGAERLSNGEDYDTVLKETRGHVHEAVKKLLSGETDAFAA